MLSDEQIAALTPHERRDLIKRLARPVDDIVPSHRWLRRTRELRILLVVGSAVLLVPWIAYLAVTLPTQVAEHGDDQLWSVVAAVVVELPLAAVLITGSLQILRLVAARLWALDPGQHAWQVRIPLPSEADTAVRRRIRVR